MVGLPFNYQVEGATRTVKYGVGNPMGAYSSWASFALSNHFIVYLSCKKAGVSWRNLSYSLLGDDIVIASEKVGRIYIEIMNSLGVEVSRVKTHESP